MTTPTQTGNEPPDDTGSGTDDDDIAAFAAEYDELRAKVAEHDEKMGGLDDINAKLDALLKGTIGNTSGRASQPRTTPRGNSSERAGTPQGQPQQAQNPGSDVSTEKKPQAQHWYFRPAPWSKRQ